MTCILKDMRQGEGSNGRGVRAKVGRTGQEDRRTKDRRTVACVA